MPNKTAKSRPRVLKQNPAQRYIRIPVDENVADVIEQVQNENPLFTELDSMRYILGKYMVSTRKARSKAMLKHWLKENVNSDDLDTMTEAEIFDATSSI